jgi:hypothetical protein
MATLSDLRDALVTTLADALPTWNLYRLPPESVDAPAVAVAGFQVDPGTFSDTVGQVSVDLIAMVSHRHVDQIDQLDELLSPNGDPSIWRALDDDPSLGDAVGHCVVRAVGDYRELAIADVPYYAATITLSAMI